MLFRQIIHEDLGCASYLVADREAGVAAVIDPQWDVEPYRRLARLHGVRIGHVLETQGKLGEALQSYEASLLIAERLAKLDPSNAKWRTDLTWITNQIAYVKKRLRSGK